MNYLLLALLFMLTLLSVQAEYPTVHLDEKLARKSLDLALLCLASYDSDGDAEVLGWEGPDNRYGGYNLKDDITGLHAVVYKQVDKSGEKAAVMAFRGTDEQVDWVTDLQNFIGIVPEAYTKAGTFAQAASILAAQQNVTSFMFTGHSLGGGLASYCALMLNRKATCFGSAALGNDLQQRLWNEASDHVRSSDSLVLHLFKKNDVVPYLTDLTGHHYGAITKPFLDSPAAYAKAKSVEEKLAYFAVSGFITRKWFRAGKDVALAEIMEGHGIDQYIAALANLVSPPGRFSPDGEWLSKGSFFDLSSHETRFRFCRNGHFKVVNDFKFFEIVQQSTNDSGYWSYNAPNLLMTIPGLVNMTYQLSKGDGENVVVWQRTSMKSDMPTSDVGSSYRSKLTAVTLELILRRMEGKTIDWQRTAPTPD